MLAGGYAGGDDEEFYRKRDAHAPGVEMGVALRMSLKLPSSSLSMRREYSGPEILVHDGLMDLD